jgi:hypothetical protein
MNMRPVVAVDLDEVLGHFVPQLAQFHNHHHGTELTAASFDSCKWSYSRFQAAVCALVLLRTQLL